MRSAFSLGLICRINLTGVRTIRPTDLSFVHCLLLTAHRLPLTIYLFSIWETFFPRCRKKSKTLANHLPFPAVWSKKRGIWIPILKILVPTLQRFTYFPIKPIEIKRLNRIRVLEHWSSGVVDLEVLGPSYSIIYSCNPSLSSNISILVNN